MKESQKTVPLSKAERGMSFNQVLRSRAAAKGFVPGTKKPPKESTRVVIAATAPKLRKKAVPEFNTATGWYKNKIINMPLTASGEENFAAIFPNSGGLNIMTAAERTVLKRKYG